MEGFLIIDKPSGITSAEVVRVIKRAFRPKKIGYIGTLDPIATGVLPVGMGRATKLFPFLEKQDKTYDAVLCLGSATDSQDRTGKTIAEADPSAITEDQVREVFDKFKGEIEQIPPMFSAKKIDGKRLYDLARQGIEVERKPIKTTIHELTVHEKEGPMVRFTVKVSTGGYVRTLCHDVGQILGVHGHLSSLVRSASGHFTIDNTIPLSEIREDNLEVVEEAIISLEGGLSNLSKALVVPHAAESLKLGQPVGVSEIISYDPVVDAPLIRVVDRTGRLLCVGFAEGPPIAGFPFSTIQPKRVMI